jgi:hypothetical protein
MANQSDFFNFGLPEGEFKDRPHPDPSGAWPGGWLTEGGSLLRDVPCSWNLLRNPSGIDMN